jgi:hypothetical protein
MAKSKRLLVERVIETSKALAARQPELSMAQGETYRLSIALATARNELRSDAENVEKSKAALLAEKEFLAAYTFGESIAGDYAQHRIYWYNATVELMSYETERKRR